jgi:anti-sigma regulatory factor (Ser/Thr protein kinase)
VTFSLDLPRELDSAAAARHGVDQLADRLGEEQLGDVRLLVSELVTNALRHADLGPGDSITLNVALEQGIVRVEVCDPGRGFELDGNPGDPDSVEGWGLYLVETLADRWGVERTGQGAANVVWFELDRLPHAA